MIKINRISKSILKYINKPIFEVISNFENGLYIKNDKAFLYVSYKKNLSPISISISLEDFQKIKQDKEIIFDTNRQMEIVDLNIYKKKFLEIDKIIYSIETANINSGISLKFANLSDSIDFVDKRIKEKGLYSLLGLGLGLTPSGDDFLAGFILGEIITNKKILDINKLDFKRTNKISAFLLKQALEGNFSEDIIEFLTLDTLAIKKVLNLGASSGSDTMLGLLYFLKYYRN